MKKQLKLMSGIGLLLLGVLGMILPIMPGIPFLIAGAAILGSEHPLIRPFKRWFDRAKKKFEEEKAKRQEATKNTAEINNTETKGL